MKRQHGVQIVYKDPKAAGSDPSKDPTWYWFDHLKQADKFAERPAHETITPAGFGGVAEVNRAERWAVEEYTEPEIIGQSFPCHEVKPGDDHPQAQCLLLKGHDGDHDMLGMVQWPSESRSSVRCTCGFPGNPNLPGHTGTCPVAIERQKR